MRLKVVLRRTFTDTVNAIVLPIVIHHRKTPPLVIDTEPFANGTRETVTNIVVAEIASVIAQQENLELVQLRIFGEQSILQARISVFFAEGNRDRFLGILATVIAENLKSCPLGKGWRRSPRFKHFHRHGNFLVEPVVRTVMRFLALRIRPLHINSRIGIKHRIRICGHKHDRQGGRRPNDVGTDQFFARERHLRKRGATNRRRRLYLYQRRFRRAFRRRCSPYDTTYRISPRNLHIKRFRIKSRRRKIRQRINRRRT